MEKDSTLVFVPFKSVSLYFDTAFILCDLAKRLNIPLYEFVERMLDFALKNDFIKEF